MVCKLKRIFPAASLLQLLGQFVPITIIIAIIPFIFLTPKVTFDGKSREEQKKHHQRFLFVLFLFGSSRFLSYVDFYDVSKDDVRI